VGAARLVEQLTALASEQRLAAIAFDVDRLDELTRARADALFELQVELQRGVPDDEREALRALLPAYQQAEGRLARVVGTVATALKPVQPQRASTYGRRGHLRGR